jgi:hypothetical protein
MEKLLARIVDDLNNDKSDAHGPAATTDAKRQSSQTAGNFDNPPGSANPANSLRQNSGLMVGAENPNHFPGSAELRPEDDDPGHETDQPGGRSTSPGRAKSNTGNRPSYPIEKTPGQATQDQTASSRAKNYLIHIRALTEIGDARLEKDEIFQTYRREVESILQKEEIPLNYREYIKNYFLSVGIHTEDRGP